MTSGAKSDLEMRRGDVLARERERERAVRNMHAVADVDCGWLDELIAGAPDDEAEGSGGQVRRYVDGVPRFNEEGVHAQVLEALGQVREFVRAVLARGRAPYSLGLLGNSGCGKTHLARLARATLLDSRVGCQMWKWGKVLEARREDRGDFLLQLERERVLILDDVGAEFLGTEKALDFSLSTLCEMLEARAGRWTLITSNMLLHQVAALDERCASRLLRDGGRVVQLDQAKDYALTQYMKHQNT